MFRYKEKNRISIDYNEISQFYLMLLRYKKNHPNFNLKKIILKLYPQVDWNLLKINEDIKI